MDTLAETTAELIDDLVPELQAADRDHAIRLVVLDVLQSLGLILYQESLAPPSRAVRGRISQISQSVAGAIVETMTGERR